MQSPAPIRPLAGRTVAPPMARKPSLSQTQSQMPTQQRRVSNASDIPQASQQPKK